MPKEFECSPKEFERWSVDAFFDRGGANILLKERELTRQQVIELARQHLDGRSIGESGYFSAGLTRSRRPTMRPVGAFIMEDQTIDDLREQMDYHEDEEHAESVTDCDEPVISRVNQDNQGNGTILKKMQTAWQHIVELFYR